MISSALSSQNHQAPFIAVGNVIRNEFVSPTLYEGMSGRFVNDLRDAVYASLSQEEGV